MSDDWIDEMDVSWEVVCRVFAEKVAGKFLWGETERSVGLRSGNGVTRLRFFRTETGHVYCAGRLVGFQSTSQGRYGAFSLTKEEARRRYLKGLETKKRRRQQEREMAPNANGAVEDVERQSG